MPTPLQERVRRIARRRSSRWVYRLTRAAICMLLYPYLRVQRHGGEHLDISGPVIVAPVHRSNLDAPLLSGVGRRPLRALAKESLFANRWFGGFIAALGAFPVRREATDREAMRLATEILGAGEQMIVFPEGGRGSGPTIDGVFDGMSYLASKAGAAIVPVGIAGTEAAMPAGARFPRRVPVAIVVGEPIAAPAGSMSRRELSRFSEVVKGRLQDAFDQAQALVTNR